jgi:hypothetical protein
VRGREADVNEGRIGPLTLEQGEQFVDGCNPAHDLEAGVAQDPGEPFPHQQRVLRDRQT